jgi:hypothetical protein
MGADDLPLDIPFGKLIEFLLDRKKLPAGWQDSLKDVQSQVRKFARLDNLPDIAEMHVLLRGSCSYFDCLAVMKLLEDHETASGETVKSMFGAYNSPVLQAWAEIIKTYEKGNTFLGEAARLMIQNTTYEIPALKKASKQDEKQFNDLTRKRMEYSKSITEYERKRKASCEDLGIAVRPVH